MCEKAMSENLSIDSVAATFMLAAEHQANHLKEKCIEFINKNAAKVIATEGWQTLTKQQPELVTLLFQDCVSKQN